MPQHPPTVYDEVPYISEPFHQTHPDSLATLASLFGLNPPGVESCRVLELGCASGGNLIPMALSVPRGHFVGIDNSSRQIKDGQELATALGLRNVDLRCMSILDVDSRLGRFDYIVAHGVYSWVDERVREKVLDICAKRLAPNGVAYISYNTYPGGHLRAIVREMMLYHTADVAEPDRRAQESRALLEYVARSVRDQNSVYARMLHAESEVLRRKADAFLLHDHLEKDNQPIYFHEFIEKVAAHGLQYVQDAFFLERADELRPDVRKGLEQLTSDPLRREQYADFVTNRRFRRSLICHAGDAVQPHPSVEAVMKLKVVGLAQRQPPSPAGSQPGTEEFRSAQGGSLSTNNPLVKIVLTNLAGQAPHAVPFDDLLNTVRKHLGSLPEAEPIDEERLPRFLAEFLLQAYLVRLVNLHVYLPRFVRAAGERPSASPLARRQAETGLSVTSLLHRRLDLGELDRLVIRHLDGKHSRDQLIDILEQAVASGQIGIQEDNQPVTDPTRVRQILADSLEQSLKLLAGAALLVS